MKVERLSTDVEREEWRSEQGGPVLRVDVEVPESAPVTVVVSFSEAEGKMSLNALTKRFSAISLDSQRWAAHRGTDLTC